MGEGLVSLWVSLDEGGEDLGVFPEVPHESIATPMWQRPMTFIASIGMPRSK